MLIHRVRTAKSVDEDPRPHTFVELEKDRWVEVVRKPDHKAIHKFVEAEERTGVFTLKLATKAFKNGMIENWEEGSPILEEDNNEKTN